MAPGIPRDIGRVRGDARGDDAFLDVLNRREPEMFGRRYITEEIRPGHPGHRAADCAVMWS